MDDSRKRADDENQRSEGRIVWGRDKGKARIKGNRMRKEKHEERLSSHLRMFAE